MQFCIIPILSANKIQILQMCWHFHGEQVHEPTSIVVQLHEHEKFRISIFGQTKLVPLNSTLFMLFKTPKNSSVSCPVLKYEHFEISKIYVFFRKYKILEIFWFFENPRILFRNSRFFLKFRIFFENSRFFRNFKMLAFHDQTRYGRVLGCFEKQKESRVQWCKFCLSKHANFKSLMFMKLNINAGWFMNRLTMKMSTHL